MSLLFSVICAAAIVGPPAENRATIALRIHVGAGRESDIVRSELSRIDPWFLTHRVAVEAHYRIVLIDDLYRARPSCQFGTGDDRHEFPAGSFSASGSFSKTLRSIADCHRWDRENPFTGGDLWVDTDELDFCKQSQLREHMAQRPEVFPPLPPVIEVVPPPKSDAPDGALPSDGVPVPAFEQPPDVP